jgi:ABC-type multidrug transport system fused ATPase/permease subunit
VALVFTLSAYLNSIAESFFRLTGKYGDLLQKSTKVRGIDHIEQAFDEQVGEICAAQLPRQWRTLAIENLTVYLGDEPIAAHTATLQNVSLTLERGKSYAFVGESGSGKSTLLNLLRGLHTPQHVTVRCDGELLPHGLAHIAHHTTLIPQEPEIFADSIRFNVSLGVTCSDEQVLTALEEAQWGAVLKRLPRALETGVAEKGVSLSGGEKQRLAVARGIFFARDSGSDIVLLDEPTSSVDTYNERLIYERLLKSFDEACVVTAIHKFNLLHLFDEVLVFANGRIVERGQVEQLLSQEGEFARLWQTFAQDEVA